MTSDVKTNRATVGQVINVFNFLLCVREVSSWTRGLKPRRLKITQHAGGKVSRLRKDLQLDLNAEEDSRRRLTPVRNTEKHFQYFRFLPPYTFY